MSKILLILILTNLLASCENHEEPSDDYVLIEFASKLEEDYDKLNSSNENK